MSTISGRKSRLASALINNEQVPAFEKGSVTGSGTGYLDESGYPYDGHADKNPYPHDRHADKDSYPHDSNNQLSYDYRFPS